MCDRKFESEPNSEAGILSEHRKEKKVGFVKHVANRVLKLIRYNQRQTKIFTLKMDHFEKIFDWMSQQDLIVLGLTCKRMQGYVGYYLKTNFTTVMTELQKNGLIMMRTKTKFQPGSEVKIKGLSSYLNQIQLYSIKIPHMKADRFESLREIELEHIKFNDSDISNIKEILRQVETVKLSFIQFADKTKEFYTSFLQYCTNIKSLCIYGSIFRPRNEPIIGIDNSWLQRKYPTLESFELVAEIEIIELTTFFELNTNLKRIALTQGMLRLIKNIFINTKLKLDVLSIMCFAHIFSELRNLLNELYEHGLYKELHLYFPHFDYGFFNQNIFIQLKSFKGLTKLLVNKDLNTRNGLNDLSSLIDIKYLYIAYAFWISNVETLAKQLVNLEFIQFGYADFFEFVDLIRHSPKLKTIVQKRCVTHAQCQNIPNIKRLNEERAQLANAKKITIYVEENVYLAVKWTENETNWSLIEIKRNASFDIFNHCFLYKPPTYFDRYPICDHFSNLRNRRRCSRCPLL